jgi:hypothetical protein
MATYLNDLRLTELATGEGSGTWGTTTNLSLELIGEALGFATQQVFGSDADATTTIADGASDPARAMYFKITSAGSLTATRTCTIAPNTISRVMFIENATTGSQSIQISQGSGASVTILAGKTAVVYLDGAGSGAAVVDAMAGVDPGVTDTLAEVLAAGNTSGANNLIIDNGQAITTNTINETTAASGVTIDSVLLKDDGVNATNLEITNLKANDGTSAGSIADSTGVVTLASSVLTTADINGGTIDGTTLGATTPASVAATTGSFSSTLGVTGAATFSSTVAGAFNGTLGATTPASVAATTLSTTGDISLPDNAKAIFGAGSDLQIYHTGTNSTLVDSGTGTFYIAGTDIVFLDGTLSERYADFTFEGAAQLYYDNAAKLATTATGIDVTGTVTADGLTVENSLSGATNVFNLQNTSNTANSNSRLKIATGGTSGGDPILQLTDNASNWYVFGDQSDSFKFKIGTSVTDNKFVIDNGGDISFYEDTGTTAKFFWDASAESLGIGTSSPEATVHIQKASAGARGATLVIDNNATSTVGNESQITFLTDEGASVAGIANARIKAISTNAGDGRADLTFTTWSGSAEGERLRIDASGNLGLGVVPTTNNISKSISLVNGGSIFGYGSGTYITANSNYNGAWNTVATGADSRMLLDGNVVFSRSTSATAGSAGTVSESMRIDSSGNVGIGVVPSAWAGVTGLQLSSGCSLNGSGVNAVLGANSYYDGTNWKYIVSAFSTNYYSNYANDGSHVWQIAPSGTAGDTITYTHAMTLDASGNLLVGGTAAGNGGTVAVTGAVSISNSTANNQASMSKESMQQTSGVTTATTIFTSIIQGMSSAAAAQLIIYGNNNAASGFMDVVVTKGSGTPVVVSSTTVEGSPAARTYTMSGSALQLAMASGTYSVNVKCTTMGFPF